MFEELERTVSRWYRSDDPERDWDSYCEAQENAMAHLPICANCGEHIDQDDAVFIDGKWYCDNCLREMRQDIA